MKKAISMLLLICIALLEGCSTAPHTTNVADTSSAFESNSSFTTDKESNSPSTDKPSLFTLNIYNNAIFGIHSIYLHI